MFNLSLTQSQFQELCGLIDAGVRATGLRGVKGAAEILGLMDAAAAEMKKTQETATAKPKLVESADEDAA